MSVPTLVREFTHSPEVTWVGPNQSAGGFSLGFDDGSIQFSEFTTGEFTEAQPVSQAKEAINGIAAIGKSFLAVSTRSDVTFIAYGPTFDNRYVFAGGAHGVISTQSGYFIAPLGMKGLLIVKPVANGEQVINVTTDMEKNLYFYRIAALS